VILDQVLDQVDQHQHQPTTTLPLHLASDLSIAFAITIRGEGKNSQIPRKQTLRSILHKDQEALC
jgi:hypothetical protein